MLASPGRSAHTQGVKNFKPTPATFNDEPPIERERECDHADCPNEGDHRAPRSPDTLDSYYWFCLDHVREYNAKWDFFTGMSQGEIEAFRDEDVTWHRPTWPTAARMSFARLLNGEGLHDLFGLMGDARTKGAADKDAVAASDSAVPAAVRDALAVMNLARTATLGEIKSRFKELVKRHHPDLNGGDRRAEERLIDVIEAYRTLSHHRST